MGSLIRDTFRRSLSLETIFLLGLLCCLSVSAKSQSFENKPFEADTTTLSPGYIGYDPEAFVKEYQDVSEKQQRGKDEFETTAAYQERLKALNAQNPFTNNTYAFSAMPTAVSYDADAQTFSLEFNPEPASHNIKYTSVLLKQGARDTGHYEAENGFGATFTVERSLVFSYELWLVESPTPVQCKTVATVPLAKAKSIKPDIRTLLLIKPVPPYATLDTSFKEPTFDDPSENTVKTGRIFGQLLGARFYDWSSGQVLASCP